MKRKSLLFALFLAVFTPQVANAQCYYALPYNYGFEEEEQFNNCWTVISGTVTRRTDHPNTGNYNLDFRGTTSNMIVMNTIFSRPTDQLRVKFHTRPESIYGRSGKFAVGYMTDIDDASTFVAVETFNSTEMTTDYVQKKVDMYNVPADSRIAMRQFDCEDNYYWFVDDVIVEQMPYCLAPVNLAANVTSTSAELSWVDRNGESVWTVYYKKAEEEHYTEVANATNPCTLTGLAVGTKYQYYVKADCGSNYELSEPSVVFSFRTLCGPITIDETPWTENFEVFNYETLAAGWNDPKAFMMNDGCWDVNYGEYVNPALYTNYKRAAFSGSTSVQFSNEKGSATLILPEFANELNTLQFEFKACVDQLDNVGTMEVGYWYNDEFTAIHSGIQTQTARGANDDTNASGDYMGPYPLNGTIPSGSRMALHYTANSTLRSCINIDDFRVSLIPSCIKPINLVASNITTNAVTLSWTENGTATSWQICLNDDEENLIETDSNPFTLEQDFNAVTLYTAKVRSYCNEDEQSDWSNAVSFETPCGTITVTDSWSENFNRLTSGIPSCWDNSEGTTTNESYRWNYYATGHEGAGLRFNSYTNSNGNTNFLKTPAIKLPADKLMQLTFWYKNPTGGDFSVYISTDGGNTYTTALATGLTGVTSWTEHPAIDLTSYFDQEVVIVFKGTSNYGDGDAYIYLDDITITENPTCPVPSALRVTDKTTTSVTFSWTNGAENQTAWQICLNGDEENLIMANSNPFTLEGLSVSTTYTAKIRTYCSENYQSDWSSELSFGTECGVITSFPWCEDFNRLIVGASIPFCWDRSEGETNFYWSYDGSTNGIGACNGTSHDGSKCISFNSFGNYDGATNSLKTPVLNLPDSPILLSFWYKNPAGGDLSVFISTDGGATYPTALFTGLIDQPTWEQKTYDLTSYAGQENVVIVFKATSNDGHNDAFIYLDDVSIMENPNCPTPTDLEVTATTATTATFSWTNGAKYQTKWQICLNDDEENLIMANSNPFTVEGLTVSTSYTAKVRTYCSENYQSDWSNEVSFEAECKDVIGLAVVENSLTTRSVTMQWDAEVDDVFDYAIELGANIDPETVTYAESITATETTCSMTWDDLIPNSDYTVFIRRNCGNGAVGQPATMTIHTEIACFAPTNLTASANYKTATVAWEGDADSYEIAWSVDSNADPDQNIDPDFQISGTTGSKEFTTIDTRYYFWVRANCGDEGYSNWEGPVDTYIGYCRPNCWSMNGNGITNLVYTGTNTVTNTTHPYAYPYYGYYIDQICEIKTDETATLDITYETGYGYKTYIWVDLDNSLSFEDSEILYTGESENSWSSTLNASITLPPTTVPGDYRMRIGGADDGMNNGGIPCYNDRYAVFEDYTLRVIEVTCPRPTDLTTTNLTTNSTTLNWESDAESFEVQYRVPYAEWNFFEGFENGLPSNWSTINGDQANDWWLTLNSASYAHSGSGCMFSNSGYDPDEWLISPQVQLHGTLKFYASNGGFQQGSEHFAVYVSTKSKAVQDFVMVGDERIIDNAQGYNEITIDINQYHGAMGYVAIRHFNSSGSMLILDDFSISYLQEEGPWIDATSGTNSLNITDLTPNTEYEFNVKAECDDNDISDWSTSAFFTTPDSYSAPYYLTADATSNTAELSWTGYTDTYNVRYRHIIDDPDALVTVILTAGEPFYEGAGGFHMLLDANADAIGQFNLFTMQYDGWFEYMIPSNAYNHWMCGYNVSNESVAIQIPAGTYDWYITNPNPKYQKVTYIGDEGNVGGQQNDYVFEAGKVYEFEVKQFGSLSGADVTITEQTSSWTLVENVTNPLMLTDLIAGTEYQFQVQGVNCDGNGNNTEWSEIGTFATTPSIEYPLYIGGYEDAFEDPDGGYYLISSPVTVNPADAIDSYMQQSMIDGDFDLYYFDQSQDLEWVNFKGDDGNFNLEPGKGYLYARKTSGEFALTGTPYSGNGVIELDYDSNATEFAGWNLLGNPYDYNVSVDKAFYVMNEEGTEITPADENMPIMPMQGFFVVATEAGQTVTFSEWEAPFVPLDKLVMNLTNKRGATIDRAIVRFDEGHQLPKFQLNKNHTKVFIPQEGKDYAIVNASEMGEMPVSFKAENNGSYTLSFTAQEVSFDYLHLIDNLTGNDIDLLANPSYTFEAKTTDYAQRFKLVFSINDEDSQNNQDNFAFISNDEIIVNGKGMLQMFDVTGRTVYAAEVNSSFRIPNSAFNSGVYVLQLVNGDQVKTQKIVVK